LAVDPNLIANGDFSSDSGAKVMGQLFYKAPDMDAVFANDGLIALAAIINLRDHGFRVPEDVMVVGCSFKT